ncbi:hypothetical protein F2P81_010401 [Scophthalmus maximus]|uniref:Uncharacterized protein n=1 Tax=Scophthalmus maximus TaxID=52904 RepID=A0A6A4SVK3_SCOMX|nr:hypothetical protein F2P81_010401 [Scophthalmus maximus]
MNVFHGDPEGPHDRSVTGDRQLRQPPRVRVPLRTNNTNCSTTSRRVVCSVCRWSRLLPHLAANCPGNEALLPLSPTSVLYKIDLGEAPFSLQTMRTETHKKARWRSAIKKKGGERERESAGRERERRLNTIGGKRAELEKRSLKRNKRQAAARRGAADSAAQRSAGQAHSEQPGGARHRTKRQERDGEKRVNGGAPPLTCVKQHVSFVLTGPSLSLASVLARDVHLSIRHRRLAVTNKLQQPRELQNTDDPVFPPNNRV